MAESATAPEDTGGRAALVESAPIAQPAAARPRVRRLAAGALGALAVVIVVAAYRSNGSGGAPTASSTTISGVSASGTTETTAPVSTTTTAVPTTVAVPSSPQLSADGAANALVASWAQGNQARALTVATPAAVSSLFANQYHSGMAIDRGCNVGGSTSTCAFGPPGGASPTDPLYSLVVVQAAYGWYVSSVQVLG